jgi:hypothetical protein
VPAAVLELANGTSQKYYSSRTRTSSVPAFWGEHEHFWADELYDKGWTIEVEKPSLTVIDIAEVGPVELTAHAVEKYVKRFDRKPEKAWRELQRIGRDGKLATLVGRSAMHDIKHRRPGRYVLDQKRDVMLVIAEPDRAGMLPRLVTVVRPEANARVAEISSAVYA